MALKLSLNPHTQVNGYISMMRNMFLTSSIAIGIFGFINNFQEFKSFIFICVPAIFLGTIILKNFVNLIN